MNRQEISVYFHVFCLVTTCLLFADGLARPNIVVIMADDMGWNDVSFHGSDQIPTPNIDALGYNGIILNRHYTMPTCTPSRAAFLTGKYPIRTGMQGRPLMGGEPRGLPLDVTILPQRLKDLGYVTRLIGKWHLGSHRSEYTPTRRGFDSHFGYWNGFVGYFDYKIGNPLGYDLHRDLNISWSENGQYATDVFTREAVHLISTHDTSQPLFLDVSHLAVHCSREPQPLEVPDRDEALRKFSYIPDPQRRFYSEMVTKLDNSVGEIVVALKEKGILNNTAILFMSDNGAQTIGEFQNWGSNWPYRGVKFTLFEGGVRGAAAIWSPLLRNPGRVSKQIIHISDWYPSLYSLAGGDVSVLGVIDGVDQWPSLLEDNGGGPRNGTLLNVAEADVMEALIDGKWKIIKSTTKNGQYDGRYGEDGRGPPSPPYDIAKVTDSAVAKAIASLHSDIQTNENQLKDKVKRLRTEATVDCQGIQRQQLQGPYCPSYCLFDLEKDPCETNNLVSVYPEVTKTLRTKLEHFRKESIPESNKPVDPASNPSLYNNTWVCWLDDEYTEGKATIVSNLKNFSSSVFEYAKFDFGLLLILSVLFAELYALFNRAI